MTRTSETDLLATKLHASAPVRDEVTRKSVARFLQEDFRQSLCITAPAGSGKSTFLRQLHDGLAARGYHCSWLNMDMRDDQLATFLPYLFAAFGKLQGGELSLDQWLADYNQHDMTGAAFDMLHRIIAGITGPSVLFLDDFHYLQDPGIVTQMNRLLDVCAGRVQVFIGSRTIPDLDLSRRILEGQFMPLPENFLQFSQEEASLFLSDRMHDPLDEEDVLALNRSTEGWVAGLQFAAISLEHNPGHKEALISGLVGRDRNLSDYLAGNVFGELPDELKDFLLKTAPLHRFNAAMCRHVSGIEHSAGILAQLMESNLFLIALDPGGIWFRYHHLFADYLTAEADRRHPGENKRIRREAGRWCIENDLPDEAIGYFLETGHYDAAADLIANIAIPETRDNGDHAKILRWVSALPERYLTYRPEIMLATSLAHGFSHGVAEGKHILDRLRQLLEQPDTPWDLTQTQIDDHLCYLEVLEILLLSAAEKPHATIEGSDAWFRKWPDAPMVNSAIVLNVVAYNHLTNNRFDQAQKVITEARLYGLQADSPYVTIWADCIAAMTHIGAGDPESATAFFERAARETRAKMGEQTLLQLMVPLLGALAAYEQGNYRLAFEELAHSAGFTSSFGTVEPLLSAWRLQAQMLRHRGDNDGAMRILLKGQENGDANEWPRLSLTMLAEQVSLHIETGNLSAARQLCQKWGLLDRSWTNRFGSDQQLQVNILRRVEIEMALVEGAYDQAIMLTRSLEKDLRQNGRPRSLVRIGILRAAALAANGQQELAWREMSAIIRAARPNNLIAGFAELRHYCMPIIRDIINHRATGMAGSKPIVEAPEEWLLRKLSEGEAIELKAIKVQESEPDLPVENLTPRESEMLELAGAGCSNAEIASHLLVREATVKWHLHNAYQKLGVKNRMAALARARALGFISQS